jgi:YbgC/YbaW family acyl-CoA thioester hydrolase
MPATDVCTVQVRANDFDWSGSLNNSVYLELFEQGRWSWARRHGMNEATTAFVAVVSEITVQFKVPVRWNPTAIVTVETKLSGYSAYSFCLDQDIYYDKSLSAAGRLRLALVRSDNGELMRSDLLFRKYVG